MGEVEAHYASLVAELSPDLRAAARRLPFDLGLTPSPEDGWEAFVKLPPNRDLPALAVEGTPLEGAIDTYRAAHWAAGYHGCLVDRIADGQTAKSPALDALAEALLSAWHRALSQALGSTDEASAAVDGALASFARGIEMERGAVTRRALQISDYGELVREKSAWVRVSALAMLVRSGQAQRAQAFRVAAELAMMAMQCADDAVDADEDRRRSGTSFPEMLRLPQGALLRAAPMLLRAAHDAAEEGGFNSFAAWLSAYADMLDIRAVPADAVRAEFGATALTASLLEYWPGLSQAWSERCTRWSRPLRLSRLE
jgi:hypothetical protein